MMASLGLGSDHAVAGFLVFSAVHLTMPSSAQGDVNTNNHELCNIAPESSQEHTDPEGSTLQGTHRVHVSLSLLVSSVCMPSSGIAGS